MLKSAKSLKRSCVMHERKYVFISLSLEKLRSSDATETGNVRNNDNATIIVKATHETRGADYGFFQFSFFGLLTEFICLHLLHCTCLAAVISLHVNYRFSFFILG